MPLCFHGFICGSKRLSSNLCRGKGYRFFRLVAVIAEVLVFANIGFILDWQIRSSIDQHLSRLSEPILDRRIVVASRRLVFVVQGSFKEVWLTTDTRMSSGFSTSKIGNIVSSHLIHDIARAYEIFWLWSEGGSSDIFSPKFS